MPVCLQCWVAAEGRETLQPCLPRVASLSLHHLLGRMQLAVKGGSGQPLGSGVVFWAAPGALAFSRLSGHTSGPGVVGHCTVREYPRGGRVSPRRGLSGVGGISLQALRPINSRGFTLNRV